MPTAMPAVSYKRAITWMEKIRTPYGRRMDEPMEYFPWQRRFLRQFLAETGEAALTLPTGAGKSTFVSAIMLAYFIGPLSMTRTELAVICPLLKQTDFVINPILYMIEAIMKSKKHEKRFSVVNNQRQVVIKDLERDVTLSGVGANPRGIHGAGFRMAVVDELAKFSDNSVEPMISSVRSRRGKVQDSRVLWIGTRHENPEHPFERMCSGRDGNIKFFVKYGASQNDPIHQQRTWHKANPSLKYMPDQLEVYKELSAAAKKDPEQEPAFKALRLNMGVEDHQIAMVGIVAPEVYQEAEVKEAVITSPYILGLDLSTNWSMSAAAAVTMEPAPEGGSPHSNGKHVVDSFAVWPGIPGLDHRRKTTGGLADYRLMHKRGELILQEGKRVVDVGMLLDEVYERWGAPYAIVGDRYRRNQLLEELDGYGFVEDDNLFFENMGSRTGSEVVGRFQKRLTEGCLAFQENRLMRSAFALCRLRTDQSGNAWIAKRNAQRGVLRGFDDAACAVVLAVSEVDRMLAAGWNAEPEGPVQVYDPETDWSW